MQRKFVRSTLAAAVVAASAGCGDGPTFALSPRADQPRGLAYFGTVKSIVDARVAKWLKKEGDPVKKGEPVAEIETDKLNAEVEANADGVLRRVVAAEGETVKVVGLLGVIGGADEDAGAIEAVVGGGTSGGARTAAAQATTPASAPAAVGAASGRTGPTPLRQRGATVSPEGRARRDLGGRAAVELDAVARTADRGDAEGALEDLAESGDLGVERVGERVATPVPAVLEQLLGGEHPVAVADELLEDRVLDGREVDRLAVVGDLAPGEVDAHGPETDDGGGLADANLTPSTT
jgi:pyruvate/2-oxoglutarate dehydrogenase complex dihydrolipoamide acyltransferase (E2) component